MLFATDRENLLSEEFAIEGEFVDEFGNHLDVLRDLGVFFALVDGS